MAGHLVLLGDSIFDNARYVPGGTSIIEHVRGKLPKGWQATLAAADRSRVEHVYEQVERAPADATHFVMSIGGNDALKLASGFLGLGATSVKQALREIADVLGEFHTLYDALIRKLVSLQKPLVICTIYDRIPGLGPAERTGLCGFNDVITRAAFTHRASLIDLRVLCTEGTDFSPLSPLEPSTPGGDKISTAIVNLVAGTHGMRVVA